MPSPHWQAFLVAAPLLAISPGANQVLSLRNALQQGTRDAVVALTGRFSAFLLLVLATAAGLGGLLLAWEPVFAAVKWCGAAYLLYLGGRMIYQSRTPRAGEETDHRTHRRSRRELARQEFLVAVTNPKALLLFAAFLPQFVDRAAGAVPAQLLALGTAYIAVEFAAALAYAGAGGALASSGLTSRVRRLLDRATGITLVAVAGWLASARH
ncbi:LysE family translocator [Actinomadura sediminis]|uniref:LysE family translocator n=1 Tax=Actinomadura sediminis TaxID=1038904 RepID=A0ABW3EM91_9ACTN